MNHKEYRLCKKAYSFHTVAYSLLNFDNHKGKMNQSIIVLAFTATIELQLAYMHTHGKLRNTYSFYSKFDFSKFNPVKMIL